MIAVSLHSVNLKQLYWEIPKNARTGTPVQVLRTTENNPVI